MLSSSLGELWADVAPVGAPEPPWLVALVVNAALLHRDPVGRRLFVFAADNGGWVFARAGLVFNLTGWPVTALMLGIAVLSLIALLCRPRPPVPGVAPRWLVEDDQEVGWIQPRRLSPLTLLVCGLAAGLLAVGVIVAVRLVEGAASSDDETFARVLTSEWVAGCVAAACVVALAALSPLGRRRRRCCRGRRHRRGHRWLPLTLHAVADGRFHAETITLFVVPSWDWPLPCPARCRWPPCCRGWFAGTTPLLSPSPSSARVPWPWLVPWSPGLLVHQRPVSSRAGGRGHRSATGRLGGREQSRAHAVPAGRRSRHQRRTHADRDLDAAPRRRGDDRGRPGTAATGRGGDPPAAAHRAVPRLRRSLGRTGRRARRALAALGTMVEEARVVIAFVRHERPRLVDRLVELRAEEDRHWTAWVAALQRLVDAAGDA